MRKPAHCRLLRFLAGVALPLALGLLHPPSQARAACGDYVSHGHGSSVIPVNFPTSTDVVPVRAAPPSSPDLHHPCPGPTCSQDQLPLPLASAPPGPQRSRESACPPLLRPSASPSSGDYLPADESLSLPHHTQAVYHPPR